MTSTEATPVRPLRKDALRNRALLLDAAREVFAERGLDASLDDIARHAGLGVGTAYRHFANRQELVAALFDDAIDTLSINMEASLAIADPWEALVDFFESSAIRQAQDRGLHQMLIGAVPDEHDKLRRRFAEMMGKLLDRAQAAGAIRPDIAVNDAAMILAMLGVTYEIRGESSPESWRRYLTIILDGLRATERGPLPVPPPSDEDFAAATAAKFRRG